jgi:phosphatidate cytidylyltransferase
VKNLLKRTATGITLVVLFAGPIWLGPIPFLVMILAVYILAISELFRLLARGGHRPCGMLAVSGATLIGITFAGLYAHANPLWFILPLVLWIGGSMRTGSPAASSLYLFWIAVPFASFLSLAWVAEGPGYRPVIPLLVIALVWINDIFAFLWGSIIGKHPMTPRISPKKTWEGFAGGFLFNLLIGWIISRFSGSYSPATWIIAAGIISILALAGDLFESGLKRRYGVKDTGTLLPGHGGILDRFDSLMFAAPAVLFILILNNLLS